jgi:hypothetical protein
MMSQESSFTDLKTQKGKGGGHLSWLWVVSTSKPTLFNVSFLFTAALSESASDTTEGLVRACV